MEKLSIEQKATRYDLAIEATKSIYNNMEEGGNFSGIEDLEVIFPELAESEDEKMVKAITEGIHDLVGDFGWSDFGGIPIDDIFDWLEKQGQKPQGKSALEAAKEVKIDNQNCINSNSKVKPKFKVGDWITFTRKDGTKEVLQVSNIIDGKYYFDHLLHGSWSVKECNEKCHLWTIEDAKDGDVLQFKRRPFIYNGYLEEKKYPFAYGGIYLDGSFFVSNGLLPWTHPDVYSATKEQCDLLFQKINESGYKWDADKKELKKIEQTSDWTEEDTNMFGSIRSTLSMYMNNLSLPKEIRDIHKKELEWLDELYDRGLS